MTICNRCGEDSPSEIHTCTPGYHYKTMHTLENQNILKKMSQKEKDERTTIQSMRDRGIVLYESRCWAICKSEMPYEGSTDHFIARYKVYNKNYPHSMARAELGEHIREFQGYEIKINATDKRSCSRCHVHFIL